MNKKKAKSYVPKHVLAGSMAGLKMGSKGEVFIILEVLNEAEKLSESVKFLIDTGFNGYLQLTEDIVNKLKLKIIDKAKSKGFDGKEVEVGILKTKVRLLDQEIWNFPIQVVKKGVVLIGTRLLKDAGKMIIINYLNGAVTLTGDKKVQKKVHKAVEKYSS